MTAPTPTQSTAPAPPAPVEVVNDTGTEIKVRFPVFLLEGMETRDNMGRRFITPGGVDHSALPLPLMGQPYTSHGGQEPPPAELIGNITSLTRHPGPDVISPKTGEPYGPDVWVWSAEGNIDGSHRFADLVRKQYLRGTSADLTAVDAELVDDETASLSEHPLRRAIVRSTEIGGGTLVPIPAFGDAYCEIAGEPAVPMPLAASAYPAGMWLVPQPMWRSPDLGDFDLPATTPSKSEPLKGETVTAAGTVTAPPIEWFRDPGLDAPTPLTVTNDGRVYGHLAGWNTSHIGYPTRRITPPRSHSDYAYFHTGAVRVLDGTNQVTISAGHIALDTGHADLSADYRAAQAHYDNPTSLIADVCAGEDAHGIWIAGAVTPGVDDLRLHKLRSCGLSGDWRRIGAGLELVAAISVPTPGFPVPRARVASGEQRAMVAAGALHPDLESAGRMVVDYDVLADALASRLEHRQALTARRLKLLTELDDTPQRVAALLADLSDGDATPKGLSGRLSPAGR